jgi:tetratricopeptide (TPR) repeat protein
MLFLIRRAGIIAQDAPLDHVSEADQASARAIVQAMDGLPLALDQAGAYIEETECGLSNYLVLYHKQRAKLLKLRGGFVPGHPEAVATTWSLAFASVERANPAAVELLRLCAFLAPDAIPEEILTEGMPDLGPVLQPVAADPFELNLAIGELLKYSLLRRNPKAQTLTIHQLVQVVLRDEMDEDTQRLWAERSMKAVNRAFPDVAFEAYPRCERLLPHAQACAGLIEQWNFAFPEAARLLSQAGSYLTARAQYPEAESLYQRALHIFEQAHGLDHPDVVYPLNGLADIYCEQGKYEQAEPLYQQALSIRQKALGPEHPNVALLLENYAALLHQMNRTGEAVQLEERAQIIRAKQTKSV